MIQAAAPHQPVLLNEVISSLAIQPGDIIVDGTFGAGGYSRAILARGARVVAFDRDPSAIRDAAGCVGLELVQDCFSRLADHVETVDGITFDIGVSSMQLDQPERGFSFMADGPLDMRMSQSGQTAAEFVNTADEAELADVIFRYGDEPKSRRIARAIVAARPLSTTAELARIVRRSIGWHDGMKKDPATRTFQALRIHVNNELGELQQGLEAAEQVLKPGGRLAVVTFHSLEDRIVKQFLRMRSGVSDQGSRHLPLVANADRAPSFASVSKPIRPSDDEVSRNPRARSATLRVAHRTSSPPWKIVKGVAK